MTTLQVPLVVTCTGSQSKVWPGIADVDKVAPMNESKALPVSNASVYTNLSDSPVTTTDGNGNYSLTAGQINNVGTGTLSFQSAGYFIAQQAYVFC
jgi:hypothetical protein